MARADETREMSRAMRRWIIERSLASNVGHIGSALSIVEIVATLWCETMRDAGSGRLERDRFILGKGHAALALYCALRWKGLLDQTTFEGYCSDGSLLGAHPDHALPGVDLSTGSLGLGLSTGCGLAVGAKRRNLPSHVFVLVSDAECNEGQVWEAAMFAAHHRLGNLTVVVDLNGSQALGRTSDILDIPHLRLWESFGWDAVEVDGHDLDALHAVLRPARAPFDRPRVVVARTVLGQGVSFMEGRHEWHYRNLTPELAARALGELAEP